MKKIMSKILIILLIIVLMFEFSCSSNVCYAMEAPNTKTINSITNLIGGIVSIILWIPRIMATFLTDTMLKIMTKEFAESCGISDAPVFKGTKQKTATPFDIFFNKYNLFDVNFFDMKIKQETLTYKVRAQVANWFYALRNLSAIILLCVLIYIGIRMAIASVAEEKARYKKMLFDWICSLALIFVLQYIAIFIININSAIVSFLRNYDLKSSGMMRDTIIGIKNQAALGMGITSIVATILYCMIIFQTFFFMITYTQRMLKVGFLIIISPLISITYSIDKIGDGKAQALNTWLKEFTYTILIQPFHCIIYLAFAKVAIELINSGNNPIFNLFNSNFNQLVNGVFAVLCIKFINDGEKAIRKIFNFQDDGSLTSMAAGAAMGVAAVSTMKKAKKIGTSVATGVNSLKSYGSKFNKAISKDKSKDIMGKLSSTLGNTKLGKATGMAAGKLGNMGNMVKNSKVGKFTASSVSNAKSGINSAQNWANNLSGVKKLKKGARFTRNVAKKSMPYIKKGTGFARKVARKSLPSTLAMMGAAMALATGSGGVMDAIGAGSALHDGTEAYFDASMKTTEDGMTNQAEKVAEDEFNKTEDGKKLNRLGKLPNEIKQIDKNLNNIINMSRNKPKGMSNKEYLDNYINQRQKIKQLENSSSQEDRNKALHMKMNLKEEYGRDYDQLDSALKEKAALENERNDLLSQESSLKYSKKRFINNKKSNASDMVKKLKNNGSEQQIDAAKDKMLQLIQASIIEQKRNNSNQNNNSDESFELTEQEQATSMKILNSMTQSIDRSVKGAGADVDTQSLIQDHNIDENSDIGENLMSAVDEYRFQQRAAEFNSIRSNGAKFGASTDKLDADVTKRFSKTTN